MTGTRFHYLWSKIKTRCQNPLTPAFHKYGARGIRVCKRWQKFENFRDDMFSPYKKFSEEHGERSTQIDRIDPYGDYCPENCRWVTPKQNARNRRYHRVVEFNNAKKILAQWSEELGFLPHVLYNRLDKYGWTIERALTTPLRKIARPPKSCSIFNCLNPYRCKGFCRNHYAQLRNGTLPSY